MKVLVKNSCKLISFLMLVVGLYSCNESTLSLNEYTSEIVIDGSIEPGKHAQVLLTKSAPYFGETDSVSLRNYVLTSAKVTLSSFDDEEVLTLKPNNRYFPPYVYVSTRMVGEIGKEYSLTVEYGGSKAYATTTIPEPVFLDEIEFRLENQQDSLGSVSIKFIDNRLSKDYYFTMSQVIHKDIRFKPTLFPEFSDEYFNGEEIELTLLKGADDPAWINDEVYYKTGDTILVKFCTIDKASYDFWNSFLKEIKNTSNPFSSTNSRVKSNVTNGLGVWCGFGSTYYQVIAR